MDAIMVSKTQIQQEHFQQNLFERFINYTDVKDITLKGYTVCIRQFINWMNMNSISQPGRDDIKEYKHYLEKQNFTAGTKAQYLRAVKHFFKWTAAEGLYPNIADSIKGAKVKADNTKKEAFSEEDIKIILDSIDRSTEAGKRNYCMILLSITGGLRIIELQRADIQDIQTIRGQKVLYIQGKGRDEKDEYVKLPNEVATAIEMYIFSKGSYKKEDPLFSSTGNRANGCRLTEPSISRIIKNVFKTAGYDCDKLTAHSLRHTSNTLLFKAGADLYTVQRHARHADPKTTEIYLHAADRENDRSEQQIYDRIFEPEKKDVAKEAYSLIQGLPEAEQQKVLSYIKDLKKAI
jgi:integrase/recombinase XerD